MNTNIIITCPFRQELYHNMEVFHITLKVCPDFGQEGKPTIRSPRTSNSCQIRNRAADDNGSICSPSFGCFRQMVKQIPLTPATWLFKISTPFNFETLKFYCAYISMNQSSCFGLGAKVAHLLYCRPGKTRQS